MEARRTIALGAVVWLTTCLAGPETRAGLFEDAVAGKTDEEKKTDEPSGFYRGQPVEFNGYVRGDLWLGKVPDQDVTEIKNGYGEVSGQLRLRMGSWGDAAAEVRARQGYDGERVGEEFSLREAYANLYLGPFDLRFGHQIIAWGRADGFNPTDNLTPRDMRVRSPLEDDRRAANLALRATLNLLPVRWELAYVPFYAPSHFPAFELPGPIRLGMPDYPDTDFEHGILASRLDVVLPSIGFSVSYLYGHATFPGLGLESLDFFTDEGPQVTVQFRAFRQQVIGADFSTTIADLFGLRGEAALRLPHQEGFAEHVPLPDIQYVLGVDREFGDLYLIVQYIGRTVLRWEAIQPTGLLDIAAGEPLPPELLERILEDPEAAPRMARSEIERKTRMVHGQTEQVSHAAFLRLQYKLLQEALSLEVMGMFNFSTREWLLRPLVTYSVTDGLQVAAGAEVYGGPDQTLYGTVDEIMSAAFTEVKAFF